MRESQTRAPCRCGPKSRWSGAPAGTSQPGWAPAWALSKHCATDNQLMSGHRREGWASGVRSLGSGSRSMGWLMRRITAGSSPGTLGKHRCPGRSRSLTGIEVSHSCEVMVSPLPAPSGLCSLFPAEAKIAGHRAGWGLGAVASRAQALKQRMREAGPSGGASL